MNLQLVKKWNRFRCSILGHTGEQWFDPGCWRCGMSYPDMKKESEIRKENKKRSRSNPIIDIDEKFCGCKFITYKSGYHNHWCSQHAPRQTWEKSEL